MLRYTGVITGVRTLLYSASHSIARLLAFLTLTASYFCRCHHQHSHLIAAPKMTGAVGHGSESFDACITNVLPLLEKCRQLR